MNPPKTASAPAPLTGWQFALGAFAVSLATFMNVLDSSIANVAIPTLSGDLGVSVDEGTWVITLFAAANAVAIPLTGWLTQRVGQVKLFVTAILLFVVASAVCGLAPNLGPHGINLSNRPLRAQLRAGHSPLHSGPVPTSEHRATQSI